MPYSYVKDPYNKILEENSNYFFEIYKNIEEEGIFPLYNKFGNTMSTLSYSSDGEASDWMLAEIGILSFSPELGTGDAKSESFYPDISTALEICRDNISAAIFGIQKSSYSFVFNGIRSFNNINNYNKIAKSLENFNNEKLYFWANCEDNYKNTNLTLLNENEYNLIYLNDHFNKVCDEGHKAYYSISTTIRNEGLDSFFNKGILKINLTSKGINRVLGKDGDNED